MQACGHVKTAVAQRIRRESEQLAVRAQCLVQALYQRLQAMVVFFGQVFPGSGLRYAGRGRGRRARCQVGRLAVGKPVSFSESDFEKF